jgi:hypothetical protein
MTSFTADLNLPTNDVTALPSNWISIEAAWQAIQLLIGEAIFFSARHALLKISLFA